MYIIKLDFINDPGLRSVTFQAGYNYDKIKIRYNSEVLVFKTKWDRDIIFLYSEYEPKV